MKLIGIYKITSPTGRIYIGQSVDIEKRWYMYSVYHCKSQSKLYRSLKKYGYKSHVFEVLELCENNNLNIRERYYQDLYDCMNSNNGLNLTLQKTDQLRTEMSQETKNKLSKNAMGHSWNKGFKLSKEVIAARIKFHTGRKRPIESKLLMRKAAEYKSKVVLKFDLDMNFIQEYPSANEAARQCNLQRPHISECCLGKSKTHGGFKWEYKSIKVAI